MGLGSPPASALIIMITQHLEIIMATIVECSGNFNFSRILSQTLGENFVWHMLMPLSIQTFEERPVSSECQASEAMNLKASTALVM